MSASTTAAKVKKRLRATRPATPPERQVTERTSVMFPKGTAERIQAVIDGDDRFAKAGVPVGGWIRWAVLAELDRAEKKEVTDRG